MIPKFASILGVALTLFTVSGRGIAADGERLLHLPSQRSLTLSEAVQDLKTQEIILVGEHHTSAEHHRRQLAVIQALDRAGVKVAIGMEMFRSDAQADLDRWSAGQTAEAAFVPIYFDNWNFDWELYAPILRYARDRQLPVVGLNVSREITSQVAREGFQSLTEAQRGKLDEVACRVDKTYMAFIKRAYGAHAHGKLDFTFFCEAQLVWDNIMAINALDYIGTHPEKVMVIITGNGHAWKGGIPTQLQKRGHLAHRVILPEIEGVTEPGMVDSTDADYLFLR
ncbi:MAG: ChaN family lipoprotein [Desulfobacterales bacterium]